MTRSELSFLFIKLIVILKCLANCDVNFDAGSADTLSWGKLKIINKFNNEVIMSEDINELFDNFPNDSPQRIIDGKLIYAKAYNQMFLDKILNKSDTYYKNCSFDITNSVTDIASNQQFIALVDRLQECTFNEQAQYAIEKNLSALLIKDNNESAELPNIRLNGYI